MCEAAGQCQLGAEIGGYGTNRESGVQVIPRQGLNAGVHSPGEFLHELACVLIAHGDFVVLGRPIAAWPARHGQEMRLGCMPKGSTDAATTGGSP